jgi:alpha-tubulin suppressor-like RCC1 family protein
MKAFLTAFLCLSFGTWCAAAEPGGNYLLEMRMDGLARVELRVTGPDLKEPVTSSLEAKDGAIAGWVAVPPGAGRSIEVLLVGVKGEVLATGKAVEDVAEKGGASLLLTTFTSSRDRTIQLLLSPYRVTLTQLDKPRKDGRIGVQARLTDSLGKDIPIRRGMLTWRDLNYPGPGGASFDPRNPGVGYFDPILAKQDKLKLSACVCLIDDPNCRCTRPVPPMRYIDVTAGKSHSCAIDQNNHAFCWGADFSGQLGFTATATCQITDPVVPPISFPCSVTPGAVAGTFAQISAGADHTCAVDLTGDVWCWGRNQFGQLGTGTVSSAFAAQPNPTRVNAGATKFKEVGAGYFQTCALGMDNLVYCWGRTGCSVTPDSQLATPRSVGTQTFKALSVGPNHACALATNGTPMCWGKGNAGQLGDSNPHPMCVIAPQAAAHAPPVINPARIAAGGNSSCIASSSGYSVMDGSITCWGTPGSSAGAQRFITTTVQMSIGGDDTAGDHMCAFNPAGTMHCWGANFGGVLGVGSTQNSVTQPSFVQTNMGFRDLDAGALHNCAINSSAEVFCWGHNEHGQLGDGTQTNSATLVRPLLLYLAPATLVLPKTGNQRFPFP